MSNERPLYDGIPEYLHRLVDDTGDAFVIGLTFGSVFHFVKGLLNSPEAAASRAVRTNAPRIAGRCAAYGALFCNFQTAMYLARGRDDYWTLIAAGTATSGVFRIRKGAPAPPRVPLSSAPPCSRDLRASIGQLNRGRAALDPGASRRGIMAVACQRRQPWFQIMQILKVKSLCETR